MAAIDLSVFVVLTIFSSSLFSPAHGINAEVDALDAFRRSLSDPNGVFASWDTTVDLCTWFHVTCNADNRVIRLDLPQSKLSGRLSPQLGKLEFLQYLQLYGNNIGGPIPAELGNLKSLKSLDLYKNNLSGSIPSSLGNLKSLLYLRVNDNHLTGPIPGELASISALLVVEFSNNNLCGKIPTTGPFPKFPPQNFKNNPRLGKAC